jgi:hypothetical protein
MITDHTLEVPQFEGDITNLQGVGGIKDDITIRSPLAVMTREQALVHAAWNFTEFRAILRKILNA